jgi:catechol 2,3-dioxygenase
MPDARSPQADSEANPGQIDPRLHVGGVTLAVSDLSHSVDFYERVLGLPVLAREDDTRALLGQDSDRPALELTQIDSPVPVQPGSTGLFHVAWLHPTRAGLAASVLRVTGSGWPLDGASDHGVSEAIYLSDPDGLGIELYVDRPRESWQRGADGHGVVMYTAPLDLDDLLAQALTGRSTAVEDGTAIGHVHLRVSDVARAAGFYRDELGFAEQARIPSAAFLSAGDYHHHIGLNSWQSRGGQPASEDTPGLRRVMFTLSDIDALRALERRIEAAGGEPLRDRDGLSVHDPDRQLLTFTSSQQDRARDRQRWPAEE